MPRVLHLYKDIFPPVYGGIEIVLSKLATHQVHRGWEVTVAVSGPIDQEWSEKSGVRCIQVGEWGRLLSNPISTGYLDVLKTEKYDVLHLHLPCPTVVLATLWTANRSVPWFASYQSDIVRQRFSRLIYAPFENSFFRRCSKIFVSSPRLLATSPYLRKHQPICKVVPLGITPIEPSDEEREEALRIRQQYGDLPIILFIGRFRWYKGLHVLLDAMNEVKANLLVVGGGSFTQEKAIREHADALKHPERIHFLGSVPNLSPLFLAANVFCLPSTHRAEAFGYVILEAFRMGLPAVTTELGTGTSFVNQNGVTGFVVPPANVSALAQALNRILTEPGLAEQMGANAKQHVTENFDLNQMVSGITDSYHEVLKHRKG